jgi:hypothetical protein
LVEVGCKRLGRHDDDERGDGRNADRPHAIEPDGTLSFRSNRGARRGTGVTVAHVMMSAINPRVDARRAGPRGHPDTAKSPAAALSLQRDAEE